MRPATLALLSLALCSIAVAQDTFTQKPVVAPAVERGATPEPPKVDVTVADWAKRFDGGPTPLWIWGDAPTKNYTLSTTFDAPGVKAARLRVSCDNRVVLLINGQRVASSDEWQEGAEADVIGHLKEKNEVVAQVRNDGGVAAFVFKLAMTDEKGATKYVVSDEKWTAAEKKGADGKPAKKIGTYGDQPWGKVFENTAAQPGSKVPANTFVTLPGPPLHTT